MSIEIKLNSIENGYTMWYRGENPQGESIKLHELYCKTKEECIQKITNALEECEGKNLKKEDMQDLQPSPNLNVNAKYLRRVRNALEELKDDLDNKFDVIKKDLESELEK